MAGLIGTALAGALAGGGSAMKENAMASIKQRHDEAMRKLDHDMDMERQQDQQEFSTGEREASQEYQLGRDETQQGYTQDNAQLSHRLTMQQERYRQGQQNARSAAGRQNNDWQLVPTESGEYVQYSPSRNQSRPANLPEGVNMGGMNGGELNDRTKYQLDDLSSRMEAVRKQASDGMRELTPEEKAQMGRMRAQYDALLGNRGQATTPLQQLMQGEPPATDAPPASNPEAGGDQGLPTDSGEGLLQNRQAQRAQQQADQQADREVKQLADAALDTIGDTGGYSGTIIPPGSLHGVDMAEARDRLQQLVDAYNSESDEARQAVLQRAMEKMQDAGVSLQ